MAFSKSLAGALAAAVAITGAAHAAQPPVLPLSETEQAHPAMPPILTLRDRAKVIDAILAERLNTVVPALMREQKLDMWVLVAREYLEDPVVATMLDARSLRARRRTILVFFDPGAGKPIERITVSRYGLAGLFKPVWDPDKQPDQWKALAEVIAARTPKDRRRHLVPHRLRRRPDAQPVERDDGRPDARPARQGGLRRTAGRRLA